MLLLVILGCICLTNAAPAPFPPDDYSEYPDDQVEVLGGPFSSEGESSFPDGSGGLGGDGVIRVYVVRARPTFKISGFPDIFGSQDGAGFNPFGGKEDAENIPFGENGGFNPFSILGGGGDDGERNPFGGDGGFNPFSVLGGSGENNPFGGDGGFNPFRGGEEDAELIPVGEEGGCNHCGGGRNPFHNGGGGNDDCGPLCLIFKLLNGLQVEIDDINDKKNDVDSVEEDGEFDVNDSTYKEKVLPDGTILKTNKTTIANTDEDGNSFIFKSTVIHNLDSGEDTTEDENNDDETNSKETNDDEAEQDDEVVKDVTFDYPFEEEETSDESGDDELPEVLHKSPEFDDIPDPSENEITGSNDGIDDGLLAVKTIKDASG